MIQNAKTVDMKAAALKTVKAFDDLKAALSKLKNVKPPTSNFHK